MLNKLFQRKFSFYVARLLSFWLEWVFFQKRCQWGLGKVVYEETH